jgi:hypothetical protein
VNKVLLILAGLVVISASATSDNVSLIRTFDHHGHTFQVRRFEDGANTCYVSITPAFDHSAISCVVRSK